jgi:recombinational DNA repair protein RecT
MQDIDKVKATSKASSGPWVEWPEEMMRKTAVKKLYKLLPQTDRMSQAVSIVNEQEGLMLPATAKERAGSVVAGIMGAAEKTVESVDAEIIPEGECGALPE